MRYAKCKLLESGLRRKITCQKNSSRVYSHDHRLFQTRLSETYHKKQCRSTDSKTVDGPLSKAKQSQENLPHRLENSPQPPRMICITNFKDREFLSSKTSDQRERVFSREWRTSDCQPRLWVDTLVLEGKWGCLFRVIEFYGILFSGETLIE